MSSEGGDEDEAELLRSAFRAADVNKDGVVSASELQGLLLACTELTEENAAILLKAFDTNGDGVFQYEEFVSWLMADEEQVSAEAIVAAEANLVEYGAAAKGKGTKVVVIGAGIAGLTAARMLLDNWTAGALDVVILESKQRLGGRVFTNRSVTGWGPVNGAEVEFGASWLHGSCPDHPVTRIKDALDLKGVETDDEKVAMFRDGKELENDNSQAWHDLLEKAASVAKDREEDISLWAAMEGLEEGGGRDDPCMQYHLAGLLFDFASPADNLSGQNFENDEKFEGTETILVEGYDQIVNALADGTVHLKLVASGDEVGKKAPDVTKRGSKAPVSYHMGERVAGLALQGSQIEVSTEAGKSFLADHVVCAIPLGVLRAGKINFSPALPEATAEAIHRVGFGNVVKIGLLFDAPFWKGSTQEPVQYYGVVSNESGLQIAEKFSYFLDLEGVGRHGLMTFAFGSSATEVESMQETDLWPAIRQRLVSVFGDKVPENCQALWRSEWAHDQDFLGTYTYAAVGSTDADFEALAAPAMEGRLHFAGEHTSLAYRGSVHGALLSGQRAATEILLGGAEGGEGGEGDGE